MQCKALTYVLRLTRRKLAPSKIANIGYRVVRHISIEMMTAGTIAGLLSFFF